jgi:allantoate deiminase
VFCLPLLQDAVRAGIASTLPTGADDPAQIFSRAGHDAMAIGAITGVGMLFLRNPDGISHHPDESVSVADVARGIQALAESVLQLAADR